jgi:hypothetical protein
MDSTLLPGPRFRRVANPKFPWGRGPGRAGSAATTADADRSACDRWVDHTTALGELNGSGTGESSSSHSNAFEEPAPLRRIDPSGHLAGTDGSFPTFFQHGDESRLDLIVQCIELAPAAGLRAVAHIWPVSFPLLAPLDDSSADGAVFDLLAAHQPSAPVLVRVRSESTRAAAACPLRYAASTPECA